MRAFGTRGQLNPAQLIERYGITCRPVRDLLIGYPQERQPMLDHTTNAQSRSHPRRAVLARSGTPPNPGIDSMHLTPEIAAAWKQRLMTKSRRIPGPEGQMIEVRERRAGALHNLAAVRAFYLDIAQWAMEDPSRWAQWVAPCPIRAEDLARQKEIRSRKSRIDQRTRERLPILPMLLARVNDAHGPRRPPVCRLRRSAHPAHVHGRRPVPATSWNRQWRCASLGRGHRHRQTPRPERRGRPCILDLGRRRDPA